MCRTVLTAIRADECVSAAVDLDEHLILFEAQSHIADLSRTGDSQNLGIQLAVIHPHTIRVLLTPISSVAIGFGRKKSEADGDGADGGPCSSRA